MLTRAAAAAAVAAVLSGCAATTPETRDQRVTARSETDCIWVRTITDWDALDDRNLIVHAGPGRAYHVELAQSCFGLDFETVIAFYDRSADERICGFGMDRIIVDRSLPQSCWISAVDELTEDQAEELALRFERERAARGRD